MSSCFLLSVGADIIRPLFGTSSYDLRAANSHPYGMVLQIISAGIFLSRPIWYHIDNKTKELSVMLIAAILLSILYLPLGVIFGLAKRYK